MHFYVLDGGSHEKYYKSVFTSKTRYSHDEFMEIVKEAYLHCCEVKSEEVNVKYRCGYPLEVENVLWSNEFKEYVEIISDLEVIKADETISVGTCITPNENTFEIESILKSSDEIVDCRNECRYKNRKYRIGRCKYD